MKKALVLFMVFVFSVAAMANSGAEVYVNGEKTAIDLQLTEENVLISVKELAEVLNIKKISAKAGEKLLPINICEKVLKCNVLYNKAEKTVSVSRKKPLSVRFFSCGLADCCFIELPDGKCMLIDSGTEDFKTQLVEYIKSAGYTKIDYVVATHPHADHIGAMSYVLKNFDVGNFYMPEISHTTKTYEKMMKALEKNKCPVTFISSGDTLFDGAVKCSVVAPVKTDYRNINNASVVLKIKYGQTSFLMAADVEFFAEQDILRVGADIDADILKVPHHGGVTSATRGFINAVTPEVAVISVENDEKRMFPADSVINRLKRAGTQVYRTDMCGDVCIVSDGVIYEVK